MEAEVNQSIHLEKNDFYYDESVLVFLHEPPERINLEFVCEAAFLVQVGLNA